MSHPSSRNSTANQSSSSGWSGKLPCVPKSSSVSSKPRPKNCAQKRLTATRDVRGLSDCISQCPTPIRLRGVPFTGPWNEDGNPACTASPLVKKLPLTIMYVSRRLAWSNSRMYGVVTIESLTFFRSLRLASINFRTGSSSLAKVR